MGENNYGARITECLAKKCFGRWTVLKAESDGKHPRVLCRCICGTTRSVLAESLLDGLSVSCGCFKNERTSERFWRHGMTGTAEYISWCQLRSRCLDSRNKAYKNYGGRGIQVCKRWMNFKNFLADMGRKPTRRHTIERVDNNGHYTPANCIWALRIVQNNNRRNNHGITFGGKTMNLQQWSRETGIDRNTIATRLRDGWPVEKALTLRPDIHNRGFGKTINIGEE